MATPSYKERMKAARAAARAHREQNAQCRWVILGRIRRPRMGAWCSLCWACLAEFERHLSSAEPTKEGFAPRLRREVRPEAQAHQASASGSIGEDRARETLTAIAPNYNVSHDDR